MYRHTYVAKRPCLSQIFEIVLISAFHTEPRAERIAHWVAGGLGLMLCLSVAPTGAISPQRRGRGTHLPLKERFCGL